jgi:hypothetical protein
MLAHGRWFSPASSTTKTGRRDIAEILLKVTLNAKNQKQPKRGLQHYNKHKCIFLCQTTLLEF